jgi:DNA repair protein RecN (Recombination protein N)
MLNHISIKDFAIIKDLDLDLHEGLNIMTGETGAGKSIIIEAISMALGSRADSDYIRTGSDKAIISISADDKDGNEYVMRREITSNGKNVCKINGELVSLGELSSLCKGLADIHGQYDHQSLLDPDKHTDILDIYGGDELLKVKAITAESYRNLSMISTELRSIKSRVSDAQRQKEIYAYEIKEIEEANLVPGEDTRLEEEIRIMQNSENIFNTLISVSDMLYENDYNAVDALGHAMNDLEYISEFSEELKKFTQNISDAYYTINDMQGELRAFRDRLDFTPELLDEKIQRQVDIDQLKRKYNADSIEGILAYREKIAESMSLMLDADDRIKELENKMVLCKSAYDTAAERLTTLRKDTALKIEKEVTKELGELNFSNALFSVKFTDCAASENGNSRAEFLITTNKGETPKPLAKIASGGELSRIMLALKRIVADYDEIPTMIFDEIDTGISGKTAGIVGEKLKSISKNHQIICITHLPQIAALGDHNYKIEKTSDDTATYTNIVPLSGEEMTEELARLLSGTEITDAARTQAKELIAASRK